MGKPLTKLSYRKYGDILEVKLSDSSYNPYFKKKATVTDKKEMKELTKALRAKGVSFPVNFV